MSPFVDVMLEIPEHRIKRKVSFLIDTGSPKTILSERDTNKLKIDYKKLNAASGNIMGLGGITETYVLNKVFLHFFTTSEVLDFPLDELLVYRNIIEDKDIINQIPSLLGRDVLNKFTLNFNGRTRNVSLEK